MVKKTKLEINNSFIEIYCSDDKVMDGLRKQSSYKPPSVYFSAAVKKKKWSGVSYLARKTSYGLQMPTGLLSRCLKFLDENKFPYAVVDSRKKPKKVNHGLKWNEAKIPFYYQAEAVEAALKAGRGMISIGTGGGKMLLASHLYFRTGVRTLILVTSREAVADTVKELKELIPGVDVAAWPNRKKITATVTVATVNAFHDRHLAKNPILKECLNKTQLLIMDEAHGVGAKEYFGISKKCNAYYKFGQSGTAFRTDKKDIFLVAASGEILYNKPASELQSEGFLTESRIIFLKTDPPNVDMYDLARYTDNDFYDATIVRNEARNNLVRDLGEILKNKRVIFVVKKIEHGQILSSMLGLEFVSGETPKKVREKIQEDLRSGKSKSVVASVIYDQSVNLPAMDVSVDCSGQSPSIKVIQRLGRILRKSKGKDLAWMISFFDGWDADVRKHSNKRARVLKKEGHKIEKMTLEEFRDEFARHTKR